jgi:serine/threonine protein kinase
MTLPTHVGPYQVVRTLGQGGMGVVYEARHPSVSRPVAVKQILADRASSTAVERFLREADVLSRVRHPGVVTVHQLGRTADGPYVVMELVAGEPLSAIVRRGPLEPRRAAELARHVAEALLAVHVAGILHRDLKPQNIIVRPDGRPVLLDFGLARDASAETLTRTGEVLGTAAYMSPEQAGGEGKAIDARTDVYGLGAVLYELLLGRPPFDGGGVQVIYKILTSGPEAWPEEPPALCAVVRMAMATKPARRYRSIDALR